MKVQYNTQDYPVPEAVEYTIDKSVLPYSNVRISAKKLNENLVTGSEANQMLARILAPKFGMLLNELTSADQLARDFRLSNVWVFKAHEVHTISPRGSRAIALGHVRSKSGDLEFNTVNTISEEGELTVFLPLAVRPFEESAAVNTPRFRILRNGSIQIEKSYSATLDYRTNHLETGESIREEIKIYLCPAMEAPADAEFPNMGDSFGVTTVHSEAPEAAGEGETEKPRRSRKTQTDTGDSDADAPVSLE